MILNIDLPPNTKGYAEWIDTAAQLMAIEARGWTEEHTEAIRREDIVGLMMFSEHRMWVRLYEFPLAIVDYVGDLDLLTTTPLGRPKGLQGDLDNYVKAVVDALQKAGVIENNKQVVALSAAFVTEE